MHADQELLAEKKREICIELTFHSSPLTPLLSAPALSAGECKASRGKLKVSRRVGLPCNPRGPCSKPKLDFLDCQTWFSIFGGILETPVMESPVPHLELTVPIIAYKMRLIFGSAGCTYFAYYIIPFRAPFSFLD